MCTHTTASVFPHSMLEKIQNEGYIERDCISVHPNQKLCVEGISFEAIPAYTNEKPFYPKTEGWIGYILIIDNQRIYIAGDTDENQENEQVICDIALVPISGEYTMNPKSAAAFINRIHPKVAIPTHYGNLVRKKKDADVFKELVNPEIQVELKLFQNES